MKLGNRSAHHAPPEDFDPYEEHRGIPMPVLWTALALAIWGTLALFQSARSTFLDQQQRQVITVAEMTHSVDSGRLLFQANCSTCHQSNGLGLRSAVPPLASSEFVASGAETVARIMLRGIDGPIWVRGKEFSGHMPSFSSALSDEQISELASFVAHRWGTLPSAVSEERVVQLRAETQGKSSFAGGEEIERIVSGIPVQPASTQMATQKVDPEIARLMFQGREGAWACASCHGEMAQGQENIPRLAGLPAGYIEKQLRDFRSGKRTDGSMAVVAKDLTDDEMRGFAAYFSGLRVPSSASPSLNGNLERGETLALRGNWSLGVPACFTCHGAAGFGVAPEFPALAAQQAPYTASQLAAWAGGRRQNSPLGLMAQISKALNTDDRRAIADYLATLAPVPAVETSGSQQEILNAGRTGKP